MYWFVATLSSPCSFHFTCLKYGSASLDPFHISDKGRGIVVHLLMVYSMDARKFDNFCLMLGQLWDSNSTIAHTGSIFSVFLSFRKALWASNTTAVAPDIPRRLGALEFTTPPTQ